MCSCLLFLITKYQVSFCTCCQTTLRLSVYHFLKRMNMLTVKLICMLSKRCLNCVANILSLFGFGHISVSVNTVLDYGLKLNIPLKMTAPNHAF
jgi:hypothetical protein